jgi:adenine C2-methylase RlmN of 23S rRNA A2503 and tRNA A37
MANNDTDFIFPPRVIPELLDLRGEACRDTKDRISNQAPDALERVALVLMMVRLGGCTTCQADSFKAMRGCTMCATQTVKRFRGEDAELFNQLEAAKHDLMSKDKKQAKKLDLSVENKE